MVNSIRGGNGDLFVQEFQRVHNVQQKKVSRGLADVLTVIEQANPRITLIQRVLHFFQRIYRALVAVVNAIKRFLFGCCLKKTPLSTDKISNELLAFDNPRIKGQIHGIYITTNETNLANIRQLLRQQPRPAAETIHIGCATWHNLDILCVRKSTYGLIVDFNPKNAEFMRKTVEMINSCESRESFKSSMIQYLNSLSGREREVFFHRDQQGSPIDRIERELVREGSWLQSEENYRYIKEQLVAKERLIPITEDIRNFEKFSEIRRFLDRHHIAVDTLYMSNICNFMSTPNERIAFEKSIKQLLGRDTIFISCPKIKLPNAPKAIILSQRALLGKEVYNPLQLFEQVLSTL